MEIKQDLGFDAGPALKTLQQLDNSLAQFEKRLASTGNALSQFNQHGVTVKNFGRITSEEAVKLNQHFGRLTTSVQLLSRIVYTQFIIRTMSQLRDAFRSAAGDAIQFQRSLALIQTIDDSGRSMEQLGAQARSISEQFNIPLLEVTAGLYQTISNQITGAAESTKFLAEASQFARATNSSTAASVDLLSGALKSFNLDVSETNRVAGIFFKTIDLGRVEANQLANAFGQVGPQAALAGLSLEEVNGAIAAISVRGSGTAQTLTQVRNILTALAKPTDEMTRVFRGLGFASSEAAVKTLGFSGVLRELAKSTGGSQEALAKLFPNVRGFSGVAALASDDLKSLASSIDEMVTAGDNLSRQKFLQATATDADKLTTEILKLKNAFTVDFGQAVLKAGVNLSDFVGGADRVIEVVQNAGPAILGVAGAFGVARLQIAAARAELGLLSKSLGALSLVPLAIGVGQSFGEFLNSQLGNRDREVLRALEAQHDAELRLVEAKLKKQRDLENKADQDRIKAIRQTFQALNQEYLRDFDNQADANAALVANTKASLQDILQTRVRFVDELARAAARAGDAIRQSDLRVIGLTDLKADREFEQRTSRLSEEKQALALSRRAQEFADDAVKKLLAAGKLGDDDGIRRALDLFARAQAAGESAQEIASRVGSRTAEARAVQFLARLTDQQISAEERLTRIQAERQKKIDAERVRQQKITEEIRKQTKIALDNTGVFDKSGNALSDADQQKRAAARQAALQKVAGLALSQAELSATDALGVADFVSRFENELAKDPVRLAIDVENTTAQIRSALENAFKTFTIQSGVDVPALERVLGRQLTTPDQIAQGLDEATKKAADLRLAIGKAITIEPQREAIKSEIKQLLTEIQSGRTSGALFGGDDERTAFVEFENALRAVANTANLTQQQLDAVIAKRDAFFKRVITDQNPIAAFMRSGQAHFGDEINKSDDIFRRLQQLQAMPATDTTGQREQLRQLEAVLNSNPSMQFQSAATALGTGASNAERMASAVERTAVASQQIQQPRFFSQVSAMGATRAAAPATSTVTNNNTTTLNGVTVTGEQARNMRNLIQDINRTQRMGKARIAFGR